MPRYELSDGFGTRIEYRNDAGELHRDGDLPAIEGIHNYCSWWYKNGNAHRIDNPASIDDNIDDNIWSNGWWLNDHYYTESDYYSNLYLYKGILNA